MLLSLVGTQKYPRSDEIRHPAIDSYGNVVLSSDDGVPARVLVKGVAPFYRSGGSETAEFNSLAGSGFANLHWTVTVTDTRVVFSAPESVGMFGGAKVKGGQMSAGHVRYGWLGSLTWGVDELWLVTPISSGQKQYRIGVDEPAELTAELASRIVAFWKEKGRDTTRLEVDLLDFAAECDPGRSVDIDDLLKGVDEQRGPVSVAP